MVDLFGGAGGISLGFEAAGFDLALAVDIDPVHCATHHFNFPYAKIICGNLADVTSSRLERCLAAEGHASVDVVVGGPPCQGFSQIGQRQMDDPRNGLVFEFCRVVRDLKPKYFVFENVPGITLGDHRRFLVELIEEFHKIGYRLPSPPKVLNAFDYGVPQNRKRLILLGSRKDCIPVDYPPPCDFSSAGDSPRLFGTEANMAPSAFGALHDLECIPVQLEEDEGVPVTKIRYSDSSGIFAFDGSPSFGLCHKRTFAKRRVYGHSGSRHTEESVRRFQDTGVGATEAISRFFRLHPDRPCNTLRAGTASNRGAHTAPRPIHYSIPRCISIREAARLHSYPDWFQFHRTIWHGFRQIGNSVAPLFAKALGETIAAGLHAQVDARSVRELPPADERLLQFSMSAACEYFSVPLDTIPSRKRLTDKDETSPSSRAQKKEKDESVSRSYPRSLFG